MLSIKLKYWNSNCKQATSRMSEKKNPFPFGAYICYNIKYHLINDDETQTYFQSVRVLYSKTRVGRRYANNNSALNYNYF